MKFLDSSKKFTIQESQIKARKSKESFKTIKRTNFNKSSIIFDKKILDKLLDDFRNDVINFYNTIREQSVIPTDLAIQVEGFVELPLSLNGCGLNLATKALKKDILPGLAYTAGPRSFPWVVGGTTPAAFMGALYQVLYDQINMVSGASIGPKLEHETIKLLMDLFGLSRKFFDGNFTTGATASNISALAIARQWWGEQYGVNIATEGMTALPPCEIYSGSPHASISKALSILGMGRKNLILVPLLKKQEAINIAALEEYLVKSKAKAKIIVASAGTVNTGDFDDLIKIKELCIKYNAWLHVDAAFGLFASCSERYSKLIKGIEAADSITADGHKWLNVPYECGMLFIKKEHKKHQIHTFSSIADYMSKSADEPLNKGIENSRKLSAISVWASLKAYGRSGYSELVERNCAFAKEAADMINNMSEYEILSPVKLNIVLFKAKIIQKSEENQKLLQEINATGKIFITSTIYNNNPALRIAVCNWQTDSQLDLPAVYEALTDGINSYKIR